MFKFATYLFFLLVLLSSTAARAEDSGSGDDGRRADGGFGVISSVQETHFSFAREDITKNFTDKYSFQVKGNEKASLSLKISGDDCEHGCGNAAISYGIYDANGQEVDRNGSAVLSAGNYVVQVRGTGLSEGRELTYRGTINFAAAAPSASKPAVAPVAAAPAMPIVSPVPEASDFALMIAGVSCIALALRRRRVSNAFMAAAT